jgi:hypothetical protein
LSVAVIADLLAVVAIFIGAHSLAAMLFILAATLALYSLLDWLTLNLHDKKARDDGEET